MGIKKQYLKSKPVCKVTFKVLKNEIGEAETVHLVGDFNHWEENATPMKKLKGGDFTVTINLDRDREYQFRYLIDGARWVNDSGADRYEPGPYSDAQNSVVSCSA